MTDSDDDLLATVVGPLLGPDCPTCPALLAVAASAHSALVEHIASAHGDRLHAMVTAAPDTQAAVLALGAAAAAEFRAPEAPPKGRMS